MTNRLALLTSFVLGLAACDGGDSGDPMGSEPAGEETEGPEPELPEPADQAFELQTCEFAAELDCGSYGLPNVYDTDDPAFAVYDDALVCALTALAAGDAVRVDLADCEGGCAYTSVYVEGRTALRQGRWEELDTVIVDEPERCRLRRPAFFQGCLDDPREECWYVGNWMTVCSEELEPVCPG